MKTKQDRNKSSVTRTLGPVETDGTLLANDSQRCWMLNVVVCCCVLLGVVTQSLKPVKLLSQQLPVPIFLSFHDRRCWIYVGSIFTPLPTLFLLAMHAHYTRIHPISRPSHNALQVPTLLLQRTQQLPTLLAQQFWKLLSPFASGFNKFHNNLCMQFTRNL